MDTAIKDGDFQTNGSGLPVRISGVRELLQRAVFRLTDAILRKTERSNDEG